MRRARIFAGGLILPEFDRRGRDKDAEAESAYVSDGESSGNEYAEGLGCADRKRCRGKASSGFEFDNVPRERYFQEPRSDPLAAESGEEEEDMAVLPRCKRRF